MTAVAVAGVRAGEREGGPQLDGRSDPSSHGDRGHRSTDKCGWTKDGNGEEENGVLFSACEKLEPELGKNWKRNCIKLHEWQMTG